jgi:GTP cyclohydrolase II
MPASQRASLAAAAHSTLPQPSAAIPLRSSASKPRARRPSAGGSYANCDYDDFEETLAPHTPSTSAVKVDAVPEITDEERAYYASRQAPRSVRLQREREAGNPPKHVSAVAASGRAAAAAGQPAVAPAGDAGASDEPERVPASAAAGKAMATLPSTTDRVVAVLDERKPVVGAEAEAAAAVLAVEPARTLPGVSAGGASIVRPPPLHVRCYARTRIPTPHGDVFCHLYRNNHDAKEHLALVVDPAQYDVGGRADAHASPAALRSRTLDEVWGPHETELERIVRGAYVGRLAPTSQVASHPLPASTTPVQPPLVRIHSECFTGETIGSQRCDCGEQLDEALRLIASPHLPRGVVVYLRQEGRGIGLLDKLMAYNLQDMGHDTVAANILLGHRPDARKYDIAAAILRDLGVGSCRLLTNNPEKLEALEAEGIRVTERVAMVPRVWSRPHIHSDSDDAAYHDHVLRRSGATMLGASTTRGPELDKYLRTKVERMGHLLTLPTP